MLLCRLLIIIILLLNNSSVENMDNNILEILTQCDQIKIYQEDNSYNFYQDSEQFKLLTNEILNLSQASREAPAFGVSLHQETLIAMKSGLWIEFVFEETKAHNEMPFDSLLINIVPEYTGFNIIRNFDGKYEGRCFYVDLVNSNLEAFHARILTII